MLTVDLSSICEVSLKGFSKNRIKRFILGAAQIHRRNSVSNNKFKSLKMVCCLRCFCKEYRTEREKINYSL